MTAQLLRDDAWTGEAADTDLLLAQLPAAPRPLATVARPYVISEAMREALALPEAPPPPSMARAVLKRQVEFAAGRWCAAEALRRSGHLGSVAVGIGEHRAPCWPAGYRGAISHSQGWAVAVTGAAAHFDGIGIDLEQIMDETGARTLGGYIGSPAEIALGRHVGLAAAHWTTLLFSAKESLFKALYPEVGHYFDFPAAAAETLDLQAGTLQLRLTTTLTARHHEGARYTLDFAQHGGMLVTRCLVLA